MAGSWQAGHSILALLEGAVLMRRRCGVERGRHCSPGAGRGVFNRARVWDLRRIREQLRRMALDWEMPAYPPPGSGPSKPFVLEVAAERGVAPASGPAVPPQPTEK
jgi:hypothetical protein